ncbi:isocitrate lyase/phosphoenolpyruvate mutase family protein [Chryseobacterium carnipullorum]|uniref:Isocitrate lyase/phosphoenolpyruvate mutase family protein n=1 Tax=Chryseobacterium carnipullorum TaxID=1124835 RepID=A0A376E394_CHRCU|nr:isocitrate lyase/phosphoenolpyruvate mutase family protein [Chryseobacterium carnipullorum]AZA50701.1 isocitrate lyase/phosphoenolpyruvate mutase family protein [Chryseobacterium carnipullorum]MDN5477963.1 isocitrate lyase/phosphoenolpyruvate mutase family protein [Chryseobacterium sp.]STD01461.1 Methylisocitrate lyase [Chryseobacterium carnipullorum]
MTAIQRFRALHEQDDPLLIGNVWDAQSARVYEKLGYQAVATSSSAVAFTLGYEDGENMSFDEYFYIIERILKSISIPLSVDLEGGYGQTAEEIVLNISRLANAGVVGINIEDSVIIDGTRRLLSTEDFFEKLNTIIKKLEKQDIEIFVNVRIDPFLLGVENAVEESLQRMKIIEEVGADGIFVPCITEVQDIEHVIHAAQLPFSVMCMPDLPDFKTLQELGVKRISSGNFLNGYIYDQLETAVLKISAGQNFSPIFIS